MFAEWCFFLQSIQIIRRTTAGMSKNKYATSGTEVGEMTDFFFMSVWRNCFQTSHFNQTHTLNRFDAQSAHSDSNTEVIQLSLLKPQGKSWESAALRAAHQCARLTKYNLKNISHI